MKILGKRLYENHFKEFGDHSDGVEVELPLGVKLI